MPIATNPNFQLHQVSRLLRCQKTQRYFTGDSWSHASDEAKNYNCEIDAVRGCVQNNLRDVELVLRAPGGFTDIFCTPVR